MCVYVIRERSVMSGVHVCLLVGGALWMAMYEASFPNIIVNSLLYRKKVIQYVRKKDHL